MVKGHHILVLEDENFFRKMVCQYLEDAGAEVYPARSLEEARHLLDSTTFDYALLDVQLPDGNSLDLLRNGELSPAAGIIIMTAEGGVETAVEAMRLGAADYLSKPFEVEELPLVFRRLGQARQNQRIEEHRRGQQEQIQSSWFAGKRLEHLKSQLNKILDTDRRLRAKLPPVLIEGETGTGKSTLARWIHQEGPRHDAPLIEVNCSTLPESLAESELFGHEKGAFTDAREARLGLFEAADGGTLFLDEIPSLPLSLQAKILTAIEDRKIRRVGGNRLLEVDVRLIAASLHPLKDLVEKGEFREDLYHRLNLLHLEIPPLRRFPEDIIPLAEHLLDGLRKRYRVPSMKLSPEARRALSQQNWPGNVRELSHELERAIIFAEGNELHLSVSADRPESAQAESLAILNPDWTIPEGFNLEQALEEITHTLIERAMAENDRNISAAARRLGVSRDYLRYRLK